MYSATLKKRVGAYWVQNGSEKARNWRGKPMVKKMVTSLKARNHSVFLGADERSRTADLLITNQRTDIAISISCGAIGCTLGAKPIFHISKS